MADPIYSPDESGADLAGETPQLDEYEFRPDFEAPVHALIGASLAKRPDSIAYDYMTAFALGPLGLNDPSAGILIRVWYVRTDGINVYVARANEINTAWEDEVHLFSASANDIVEIDLAFTQNGDPVVVMERAGHIWVYWFDPVASASVQTDLGTGRNPRVAIDDPLDTSNSDVQIFYIDDTAGRVRYRTQRERYAIANDTPLVGVGQRYLEEVYRGRGNRLHILFSEHNPGTGRWSLGYIDSLLFGFRLPAEMQEILATAFQVENRLVIFEKLLVEAQDAGASVVSADNPVVISELDIAATGTFQITTQFMNIQIVTIVITKALPAEGNDAAASVVSATNPVTITIIQSFTESQDAGASMVSGVCAVP
jgi:hypothetical protein